MPSQDLIYSVLARPLGNQVSQVKTDIKQVSETARLKSIEDDEQAIEQYRGNERRKNRRERRNVAKKRVSDSEEQPRDDKPEGGLDLYA